MGSLKGQCGIPAAGDEATGIGTSKIQPSIKNLSERAPEGGSVDTILGCALPCLATGYWTSQQPATAMPALNRMGPLAEETVLVHLEALCEVGRQESIFQQGARGN